MCGKGGGAWRANKTEIVLGAGNAASAETEHVAAQRHSCGQLSNSGRQLQTDCRFDFRPSV
jgi:hypothetical protein